MNIGTRIKVARKRAGLSQEAAARLAGLSLNGYADLERNKKHDPHISSLRGIAEALEVPITALLEDESPAPDPKDRSTFSPTTVARKQAEPEPVGAGNIETAEAFGVPTIILKVEDIFARRDRGEISRDQERTEILALMRETA